MISLEVVVRHVHDVRYAYAANQTSKHANKLARRVKTFNRFSGLRLNQLDDPILKLIDGHLHRAGSGTTE